MSKERHWPPRPRWGCLVVAAALLLAGGLYPVLQADDGRYVAVVFVDKPTYANDDPDPFTYFKVGKNGINFIELCPEDDPPVARIYFSSGNLLKIRWREVGGWEEKMLP